MTHIDVNHQPEKVDPSAWVARNATLTGSVNVGSEATIWFGAVIRGDVEPIEIGSRSNIQDLCCLHSDPGFPCRVGEGVVVGHRAILHGAIIENECLIGMGAIVLNGAVIGEHSIVGAGALVPEGRVIPPGSLVVGVPGKVVRQVSEEEIEHIRNGAARYVEAGKRYRNIGA